MQKPSNTSGQWLILQWKRKPKRLGTGFGWIQASLPAAFSFTWRAFLMLEKEELKVKVWPSNVA